MTLCQKHLKMVNYFYCGGGEIRTHDTVSHMTVFKTVAFNHSATPPFAPLFKITLFFPFFQV